jgi:hypothetical protein
LIQLYAHRRAITVAWFASGACLVYGVIPGKRRHRRAVGLAGLVGLAAAGAAHLIANRQDAEITRNPEVMNGHFITDGKASAIAGDLGDVDYLRALMIGRGQVSPAAAAVDTWEKGGRHGDRLRR